MIGKIDVAVGIWVNWALKKMSGKLIKMHVFFWVWAIFVDKYWGSVEGCSSNTSNLGSNGWYNRSDRQNEFEFNDVSKNLSAKLINIHVFLGF